MHRDPKISTPSPPGSYVVEVDHPDGITDRQIEVAIFQDHRYSFYYWASWHIRRPDSGSDPKPPTLVTIDWHRDLAPPSPEEEQELDALNLLPDELQEICDFTVQRLDPHNDGHLLSALRLNLIGDVILLKNYGTDQRQTYHDRHGNPHMIREFPDPESFRLAMERDSSKQYFLDMDIDYFIHNKVAPYQLREVEPYSDREIKAVIDPASPWMQRLLGRLQGVTIATEPRYCGGVRNSNRILNTVLDRLFTGQMDWRHLANSRP